MTESANIGREHLAQAGLEKLPANWNVVSLGDILCDDRGISVGVMYPGDHDPEGVPLIKAGDMNGSIINPRPDFKISKAKHQEYRRTALEGGELLMTLVGDVGQCAVVPPKMAGWNTARAVAVMRLADPSDVHFVRQCLLSRPLRHLMDVWSNTTVQATLNLKEIRQLPLPWPPKRERDAIAEFGKSLDDKIELNRRMNATLETITQAIYHSLTGVVSATELPLGWRESTIGEEVRVVGGSTPSTTKPEFWEGGAHHWATPKDLSNLSSPVLLETERRITEAGLQEIGSGLLPAGTVLLSSRAPIGYLVISEIPVAVNQGFIAMICDQTLPNYFVWLWTKNNIEAIKGRANGTTFMEISKANFRPLPVLVPPAPLLNEFKRQVEPLHSRMVSNQKESSALAALRDTLLPELLSGVLRIPE